MDVLLDNLDLFGPFFLRTIELFLIAGVGSLVFGTILAMLRVSPVPVLRSIGTVYVTVVRNTPLTLVFAFFVFAYPRLGIVDLDYFTYAVIALTVYTSAFICEVVRSGINTVPVGQAEAARALGLTFGQILGQIVLPQSLRSVVPPLISTLIALLKNSTIASGFSVAEAGAIRQYISERGDSQLVALLWVALGFIILVAVLSLVQRSLEKRWSVAR
ncbi:amino acid ABC transporter permease [Amycolatopsis sp. CA-161197]|uniref:amino acid ABC transporter permease n=1 Tax=unclassified Amycolatopsis TaxID=2618356 RepID=UPI003452B1E7